MPDDLARLLFAAVFSASVLATSLYVLTAAGHFPSRDRLAHIRSGLGPLVLWGTMAATAAALVLALLAASRALAWPYAVLAACIAILFAPLVLQRFPDSIVDGRRGLLGFSALAFALAGSAWSLLP